MEEKFRERGRQQKTRDRNRESERCVKETVKERERERVREQKLKNGYRMKQRENTHTRKFAEDHPDTKLREKIF
jgi:hypothetical protein